MKNSSEFAAGIAVAIVLVGCQGARTPVPPPVVEAPEGALPKAGLRVVLLWNVPVDLDLYVTDPAFETVYFANPRSGSGGRLEKDAGCGPSKGAADQVRREVTSWPAAPPGRYRVGLDFIERCGRDEREVGYRLLVDAGGRRQEKTGTIRLARFVYQAFEFDVGDGEREESSVK